METVFSEDIPVNSDTEHYEFRLRKAPDLRCSLSFEKRDCGMCESCKLAQSIATAKEWFCRCCHQVQKSFLMGLVQRFHSVDLLKYIVQLLKPCLAKDFTYARNRMVPSLETDRVLSSSNHALVEEEIDRAMKQTWGWFVSCNYWTKCNFTLGILSICDVSMLFMVGNLARTLLGAEVKAFANKDSLINCRVTSAAVSSRYSSPTPTGARSATEMLSPLPKGLHVLNSGEIVNDESDGEVDDDDPTLYILPNSEKAWSGIARHRDFIKDLPVHLSKCILGYFDEATLFNCRQVSKNWKFLVEEMRREFYANQQMWEDIMIMQGSSGVSPQYANDIDILVPNIKTNSQECIRLNGKTEKDERFKSEMNMENAYNGFSTRKVIMEERNLYCGSYNVLVLVNKLDSDRVIHVSGGKLLAYSKERRCHLIDINTGRETDTPIAGHSGSVHCVNIQEDENFVLTGSYDTSVRKWDLQTLKCVKIFMGHQNTVVAMDYCRKTKQFASASLDKSCKVWNINSKKCWRTFKHRGKVLAVSLGVTQCITGCEQGRVKVWDLMSGRLIKMLVSHEGPITAIRFDKWHIVTAARDGYALAWSNQGDHKRCLTALRHPCPVLCMEFLYLRVLTGAEDGRVRIWNMVNGQCCRIMRGNSQSDPVITIHAIDDRLTINTKTNVLMLTFENIEWDYSLSSDKVISMVERNKFRDAPTRSHPHAYIRAQRMAHIGSADPRVLGKAENSRFRTVGSRTGSTNRSSGMIPSGPSPIYPIEASPQVLLVNHDSRLDEQQTMTESVGIAMQQVPFSVTEKGEAVNESPTTLDQRRVSWAFDRPLTTHCAQPSLYEMKALLRKQIRNVMPTPEFIYLTISAMKNNAQSNMKETSTNRDFLSHVPEKPAFKPAEEPTRSILKARPNSSPSRIDSRSKVRLDEAAIKDLTQPKSASKKTDCGVAGVRMLHSAPSRVSPVIAQPTVKQRDKSAQLGEVSSREMVRCQSAESSWRNATTKRIGLIGQKSTLAISTSAATEISAVPMLMYPKDGLKPTIKSDTSKKWPSNETLAKNHPLTSGSVLKLMTYTAQCKVISALQQTHDIETKPGEKPNPPGHLQRPASCKT